jgi:hypothetical protein
VTFGKGRAAGGFALFDLLLEAVSVIADPFAADRDFHGLFYT